MLTTLPSESEPSDLTPRSGEFLCSSSLPSPLTEVSLWPLKHTTCKTKLLILPAEVSHCGFPHSPSSPRLFLPKAPPPRRLPDYPRGLSANRLSSSADTLHLAAVRHLRLHHPWSDRWTGRHANLFLLPGPHLRHPRLCPLHTWSPLYLGVRMIPCSAPSKGFLLPPSQQKSNS